MSMILSYELAFLLSIFVVLVKVPSILLGDLIAFQAQHGAMVSHLSGIIAFVVAIICLQAKLGYLPFDIAEAETELIGGPLAEYSGSGLALFKLSRAMMFVYLPILVVILFMGSTSLMALSLVQFILKVLGVLVFIIFVKVTHARLRLDQTIRFFWGKVFVAAVIAVILAYLGW
jgi:NADH-quinone oxidoreductase subunit H